ncbi:class I SAM-dependent methyltransferase [Brevibacillus reuszeri]|uniref:class I SAM-dependent methyltransferase n=1 Tax=Brevibacillus reuszeri TaxID=54915 RepID=UPI000CCC82D4|nr:methyltransferase [Brevibacillus reuszeri]
MLENILEKLLFLYKFSCAPKQIGSLTPSSIFLAKKMLEPVKWNQARHIAELGAGTGAITKYIKATNTENAKVLLFEKDTLLRNKLAERFHDYTCYPDACYLQDALQNEGMDHLDCILSGLPFFNFPQQLRDRLMEQIVISLRPGGLFIAFQYSQQMKKQLSGLFEIEEIHYVPLNIPPAFVYVCRKR